MLLIGSVLDFCVLLLPKQASKEATVFHGHLIYEVMVKGHIGTHPGKTLPSEGPA